MTLQRHGEIIAEMQDAWQEERTQMLNQVRVCVWQVRADRHVCGCRKSATHTMHEFDNS